MVLLRALLVWLLIVFAEIVHGIVRGVFLVPHVGQFRAGQIGVFTGSAIILIIAIVFARWIRGRSIPQLLGVGFVWLVLMIGFEIAFGRFVVGASWERIGSDYNILKGGLMPIGMIILMVAPVVAARVRGLI